MREAGIAEVARAAAQFGLHRNGEPSMEAMLSTPVGRLTSTQAMLVAVLRAVLAETDVRTVLFHGRLAHSPGIAILV
eukprot:COSAG01_NODE_319_length_18909_cov_32.636151_8_plen_77_part_00